MLEIRQFVVHESCLNCLGCCRYNLPSNIWLPQLLEEEKGLLNIERLETIPHNDGYICFFLNPEDNRCQVYERRPLECRIYPFIINRQGKKLFLGIDIKCPAVSDKIKSEQFREHRDYLIEYFKSPLGLTALRNNRRVFCSYPADEILNLTELII
ncbi:MAG: YkgJ family cysteine cluster protein [Candidatus Omnitrophota bacterium]